MYGWNWIGKTRDASGPLLLLKISVNIKYDH